MMGIQGNKAGLSQLVSEYSERHGIGYGVIATKSNNQILVFLGDSGASESFICIRIRNFTEVLDAGS